MSLKSWDAYTENGENFFNAYEALRFADVHRAFLRFLPPSGSRCLDVGAGSGRDAAALVKRGHLVTAVEPNDALRELGRAKHSHRIRWVNDALPSLSKIKSLGESFRFILLSAVWMHLPRNDWDEALASISQLLHERGCIAISLRFGPDDADRNFHSVEMRELIERAAQFDLFPVYVGPRRKDRMGRSTIEWRKLVLARPSVRQQTW